MRRMRWAACLWPGLPQLCFRGSWLGLAAAVAAAALLNLALLDSFVWCELIGPDLRRALWIALGMAWIISVVYSVVWSHRQAETDSTGDTFSEALAQYLKGNWFEAEQALGRLLRSNARDLDARLMLATLLRHTGRLEEASAALDQLSCFEGVEKWELEIRRERELLAEAWKNKFEENDNVRAIYRPRPEGHAIGQPGSTAIQS